MTRRVKKAEVPRSPNHVRGANLYISTRLGSMLREAEYVLLDGAAGEGWKPDRFSVGGMSDWMPSSPTGSHHRPLDAIHPLVIQA